MPSRILLVLATAIVTVGWTHGAFAQATESPRFDIQRFVVEGNTILPQAEVEQIVAPFAGSARDFGDVQQYRLASFLNREAAEPFDIDAR